MSETYRVNIDEIRDSEVDVRVRVIHPDVEMPKATDLRFFFDVYVDVIDKAAVAIFPELAKISFRDFDRRDAWSKWRCAAAIESVTRKKSLASKTEQTFTVAFRDSGYTSLLTRGDTFDPAVSVSRSQPGEFAAKPPPPIKHWPTNPRAPAKPAVKSGKGEALRAKSKAASRRRAGGSLDAALVLVDRMVATLTASKLVQVKVSPAKPVADAAIDRFETEHGVALPEDYRSFLQTRGTLDVEWSFKAKDKKYGERARARLTVGDLPRAIPKQKHPKDLVAYTFAERRDGCRWMYRLVPGKPPSIVRQDGENGNVDELTVGFADVLAELARSFGLDAAVGRDVGADGLVPFTEIYEAVVNIQPFDATNEDSLAWHLRNGEDSYDRQKALDALVALGAGPVGAKAAADFVTWLEARGESSEAATARAAIKRLGRARPASKAKPKREVKMEVSPMELGKAGSPERVTTLEVGACYTPRDHRALLKALPRFSSVRTLTIYLAGNDADTASALLAIIGTLRELETLKVVGVSGSDPWSLLAPLPALRDLTVMLDGRRCPDWNGFAATLVALPALAVLRVSSGTGLNKAKIKDVFQKRAKRGLEIETE